jgi:hypothetical protein
MSRTPSRTVSAARVAVLLALCGSLYGPLCGCTAHLFSGVPVPDRSRPVVRIETRGGVEYGAATELGVLFLGRTAQAGPCRVHYYLGPDRNVDDGEVIKAGGVYYHADVDLDQQWVPIVTRELRDDDELFAMRFEDESEKRIAVQRVLGRQDVQGDLLIPPTEELPVGTALFLDASELENDDRIRFVGLIAGRATLDKPDGSSESFLMFTGIGRLRDLLATPYRSPAPTRIRYRADGSWYREPMPEREIDAIKSRLDAPQGGAFPDRPLPQNLLTPGERNGR